MIRVAYYFGRYDATRAEGDSPVPPEIARLGITSRAEAIELFRTAAGDGRSAERFRNSLCGDIRYIATALRDGSPLGESRRIPVGALLHATDTEVWEAIQPLIATDLLPESG